MQNRLPLVISIAALAVAVLGTTPLGHAAHTVLVPEDSVGTPQLRNLSVTGPKIRGDAVDSGKIRNRSLKAVDFALGQIPQGLKGDKGDKGEQGATNVVIRQGTPVTTDGSGTAGRIAKCEQGEVAVGGGVQQTDGAGGSLTLRGSAPTPLGDGKTPTGWQAYVSYTAAGYTFAAYVICAKPST